MGLAVTGDGRTSAARQTLERGGPVPLWRCIECDQEHGGRWAVRWLRGRVCRECVRLVAAAWLGGHPEENA